MLPVLKEVPLETQITAYAATPLDQAWRRKLLSAAVTIQTEEQAAGVQGEMLLAKTLSWYLSDDYYFLGGLVLFPDSDIDALVVGPTGVWTYESKYWAGNVVCKGGSWVHYKREGDKLEQIPAGSPDGQWLNSARRLEDSIKGALWELEESCPQVLRVRGAVVFTYPQARCVIESPRAPCVTLDMMQVAPEDPLVAAVMPCTFAPIPGFQTEHRHRLLARLLAVHRQLAAPALLPEFVFQLWLEHAAKQPAQVTGGTT